MEGPGIDDIQPVPVSPRLQQHENPAICSPAPGQGRCEPNTGGLISQWAALSCLSFTTPRVSSETPGHHQPCVPSLRAEILSPPHHLSLDGATTSTPHYLMLAQSQSSYLIQLWIPTLSCGSWHRDDTGPGTRGYRGVSHVTSHQPTQSQFQNQTQSQVSRDIATSHWQTTHGNLSFSNIRSCISWFGFGSHQQNTTLSSTFIL